MNNDTVLAGLLDLGDDNGALLAVSLVEAGQVLEGEIADDVRVEDEERRIILAEDLLCELQGTSGAQWLGLDGEGDIDVVLFFIALEGLGHDLGAVVDGEDDVSHASLGQSLDLVNDHGSVAELDKRLGEGKGERAKTGAEATDENEGYICFSQKRSKMGALESRTLHVD